MGAIESQIETGAGIGAALFGAVRRRVLGLLFRDYERDFYQREIVESVARGSGAVQRELKQLADAGLITRTERGRMVFYQANRESPVFAELRGLVMKTSGLAEVLREALEPGRDKIAVAFIYGSMAAGTDDALSDVDLMIIGDLTLWEHSGALAGVQSELGREINPVYWSPAELRQKLDVGEHFTRTVIGGPKTFLIGGDNELRRLMVSD
ncbi:MAG TPA: ArsR family transcriptional regulator [Armatimonadetes bacterium]|nr:ArsR family transcriptional regulator [Armatimonadota bacterium]